MTPEISWSFDPTVLLGMVVLLALYAAAWRRPRRPGERHPPRRALPVRRQVPDPPRHGPGRPRADRVQGRRQAAGRDPGDRARLRAPRYLSVLRPSAALLGADAARGSDDGGAGDGARAVDRDGHRAGRAVRPDAERVRTHRAARRAVRGRLKNRRRPRVFARTPARTIRLAALQGARDRLGLRLAVHLGRERVAVRTLSVIAADGRGVGNGLALDLLGHLQPVQGLAGQRALDPGDRERHVAWDRRIQHERLADLLDRALERAD